MGTTPIISSGPWVRGLLRMFESQGVGVARLLEQAGVDQALLADPHATLDYERVDRLWQIAAAVTGQETLGLDRDLAARYIDLEVAANWVGSHATLGSVLQSQASYAALSNNASAFTLETDHPNVWLTLTHGNDRSSPRQRSEYAMLAILLVGQRATRTPLRPLAAEFVWSEPADLHRHRMAFPCPLRFDRPANRLLVAGADLALPMVSGSALEFVLEERVLESLLATLGSARTSFLVAQELVRRLRKGEPQSGLIAGSIGLTDTLLARQLRAERTSQEELLDLVRRELAHEYLAASDAPLPGIPGWLGMNETDFVAASRRWFGLAPSDYRRQRGPDGPAP